MFDNGTPLEVRDPDNVDIWYAGVVNGLVGPHITVVVPSPDGSRTFLIRPEQEGETWRHPDPTMISRRPALDTVLASPVTDAMPSDSFGPMGSPQRAPGGGNIPPAVHGNKSQNDIEVEHTIQRSIAEKEADPTHNLPSEGDVRILEGPKF